MRAQPTPAQARRHVAAWVERFVIAKNLCPFAARLVLRDQLRYVVTSATDTVSISRVLCRELRKLSKARSIDEHRSTIIILTQGLPSFQSYWRYVGQAERILVALGLEGTLQLATFHPRYRFAKTSANDVSNYTNRSPYPLLHLLREDDVEKARATYRGIARIPQRNVALMRRTGMAQIRREWRDLLR